MVLYLERYVGQTRDCPVRDVTVRWRIDNERRNHYYLSVYLVKCSRDLCNFAGFKGSSRSPSHDGTKYTKGLGLSPARFFEHAELLFY